jgi:plasmid maintenance system antidote protein VapI
MGKDVVVKGTAIVKVYLTLLNIKPCEIAKELNISRSFMSKIINGERKYPEFNSWLARQIVSYLE